MFSFIINLVPSNWQDTYFSVLITKSFIEPIAKVLEEASAANQSEGYKRMQQTKWHTLVGSTLVVFSSTFLYINCLLCFMIGGPFWASAWLNVSVFGMNLDSILNDIGMIVLSGALKNASVGAVSKAIISTRASSKKHSLVEPMGNLVEPRSPITDANRYGTKENLQCPDLAPAHPPSATANRYATDPKLRIPGGNCSEGDPRHLDPCGYGREAKGGGPDVNRYGTKENLQSPDINRYATKENLGCD
jgi:hypothetical protein